MIQHYLLRYVAIYCGGDDVIVDVVEGVIVGMSSGFVSNLL